MALPSKAIESMEQIAEKLDRWANDKKRHRMLCNDLPNLGCRVSLNEPLRGFGTILLKLKCWRPEAAESIEKKHRKLLSIAKEIDQAIKDGRRDLADRAFEVSNGAFLAVGSKRQEKSSYFYTLKFG